MVGGLVNLALILGLTSTVRGGIATLSGLSFPQLGTTTSSHMHLFINQTEGHRTVFVARKHTPEDCELRKNMTPMNNTSMGGGRVQVRS